MKKIFLLLLIFTFSLSVWTEDEEIPINREAEKVIVKALQYMANAQNADGSFSGGSYGKNVGIHGLVMMAFMSMGNMPGEGEYGDVVAKALDWLLLQAKPSGLIENSQMKNRAAAMYGHALATLALSEIWGQTRRKDVGEHLVRAIDLIVKCQGPKGSWGYYSTSADGDTSVTVMQVFALKSAHEAGVYVPKVTMEKALAVIKSRFDKKNKMYGYNSADNNINSNHAGSHAAGTCIMQICGETELMYTKDALEQVVKIQDKRKKYDPYFTYYGSVCSYYAGKDYYKKWREITEPLIIKKQNSNGEIGDMLGTAWGVLSLSLPYRYIPVYQHEEK